MKPVTYHNLELQKLTQEDTKDEGRFSKGINTPLSSTSGISQSPKLIKAEHKSRKPSHTVVTPAKKPNVSNDSNPTTSHSQDILENLEYKQEIKAEAPQVQMVLPEVEEIPN